MNEFSCRVTTHGQQQLELQLTCPLAWQRRKVRYRISVYLFFPHQLQMTESRYGVKRFLQDLVSYTRFTTPVMSMRMLADKDNDKSPFVRIHRAFNQAKVGGDLDEQAVEFEIKSLVNMIQRQLKDGYRMIRQLAEAPGSPEDALVKTGALLQETDTVARLFRDELRPRFLDPSVPAPLRKAIDWADESISLSIEKCLFRLYGLARKRAGLEPLLDQVAPRLPAEAAYRRDRGYPTVVDPASPDGNVTFLQQESMLKKWAQKTYYMTQEKMRSVQHLTTLLMAVAAMIAMVFAVLATFLAGRYFPQNSLAFALMLVIAYGFKDRIKETLRAVFLRVLPRLVSDRRNKLISPIGKVIGSSSLHVVFSSPAQVPGDIRRLRNLADSADPALVPPEDVIEFHKQIGFEGARIKRMHSRLESVTEILRFYLGNWLQYMDDPREELWHCNGGGPAKVPAERVYPVRLLLNLEDPAARARHLYGYTLYLSREGIVRIRQESHLA